MPGDSVGTGFTASAEGSALSAAESEPSEDDFSPQLVTSSAANSRRSVLMANFYHRPGAGGKRGPRFDMAFSPS